MNRLAPISALLLLTLTGCTVGPNHTAPTTQTPEAWPEALVGGLNTQAADLRTWWHLFGDATLDSLVDRALAGSLDLREAAARVQESRALRGITAADRLPSVDAVGSASYNRESENTLGGPGGAPGQQSELYEVGFDASWEIDLFGRVRRSVEAADADLSAAIESERDARVVLISEVARSYIELRSAQTRLTIARENLRTQEDTLGLSQDRFKAGLDTELQVAQSVAQVESSRSQIPGLMQEFKRAGFRLDVLLGLQPGTLAPEWETEAPLPPLAADLAIGVPADLLRRRPDIRRAERELAAASARVGVATADLYPRLTLNGSFGLASEEFGNLFEADSRTWGVGPLAVRWPVFDAGRVRSGIRVQEARQEIALVAYERTVLEAYEEVANALVAYARVRERRASLSAAVDATRQAVDLANDLWSRGLTDFLNVLDTQRELFELEDQLAASDAEVATNLVALYKALGGGWDEPADATTAQTSRQDTTTELPVTQ